MLAKTGKRVLLQDCKEIEVSETFLSSLRSSYTQLHSSCVIHTRYSSNLGNRWWGAESLQRPLRQTALDVYARTSTRSGAVQDDNFNPCPQHFMSHNHVSSTNIQTRNEQRGTTAIHSSQG